MPISCLHCINYHHIITVFRLKRWEKRLFTDERRKKIDSSRYIREQSGPKTVNRNISSWFPPNDMLSTPDNTKWTQLNDSVSLTSNFMFCFCFGLIYLLVAGKLGWSKSKIKMLMTLNAMRDHFEERALYRAFVLISLHRFNALSLGRLVIYINNT